VFFSIDLRLKLRLEVQVTSSSFVNYVSNNIEIGFQFTDFNFRVRVSLFGESLREVISSFKNQGIKIGTSNRIDLIKLFDLSFDFLVFFQFFFLF